MKKLISLCVILFFVSIAFATDYEFYRGDDHTFALTFTDSAGAAVDISTWTVFFTMKTSRADLDANALITKDITVHDDATNGETSFIIYSTETASRVGSYYYDMQYRNAEGRIRTFDSGSMEFLEDITIRTE